MSAENAKAGTGGMDDPPFVVANSMREVQPEINLLVSPCGRTSSISSRPARRSGFPRDAVSEPAVRRVPAGRPAGRPGPGRGEIRQAQPRQGGVGPPVHAAVHLRARARSWTFLSSRSCRPGWTTGTGSGGAATRYPGSGHPGCWTSSGCTCARPEPSSGRTRGSRSGTSSPARATISASRRGCSRSGCAARDATCSGCCPSSPTPTPIRSAPTWPASSTCAAPAGRRAAQGGPAHRRAGPVPARLRARAPGRVPLRPVGAPRPAVPEGRVPGAADGRPDGGQGRVGDDPLRVLR